MERKALLARRAADKIEPVDENVTLEPNGSARKTVADGREWPNGEWPNRAGGGGSGPSAARAVSQHRETARVARLRRMTELCCSFCGKAEREVASLFVGPAAYICNECIVLCTEVLAEGATLRATEGKLLVRVAHFMEKMARYHAPRLAKAFGGKRVAAAERELATALAEHLFDGGIAATAEPASADSATALVCVKYVARPSRTAVLAAIAAETKRLVAVHEERGVRAGVLLLVQRSGPTLVLPPETDAGGRALLLGALHVGRRTGAELHVGG